MSDSTLHALKRHPDTYGSAAHLREVQRAGRLDQATLELLAYVGVPGARELHPVAAYDPADVDLAMQRGFTIYDDPRECPLPAWLTGLASFGPETRARVALLCGRAIHGDCDVPGCAICACLDAIEAWLRDPTEERWWGWDRAWIRATDYDEEPIWLMMPGELGTWAERTLPDAARLLGEPRLRRVVRDGLLAWAVGGEG